MQIDKGCMLQPLHGRESSMDMTPATHKLVQIEIGLATTKSMTKYFT
jgi:hypothetical protein